MQYPRLLENKRIFVVEDDPDNIYVLRMVLRNAGAVVEVDWWARGESKKIVNVLPLDMILLDLMLSGNRSGFDVFDEIRDLPQFENIPIVAVSAMDISVAVPKARLKGFAGFISKPIDDELFPKQLKSIIEGEEVWG